MRTLLVSALRMFRRDGLYIFISLTGLAVGITVFMLVMAFVRDDLTWDSMHEKGDRICRIVQPRSFEGKGEMVSTSVPIALGPALKEKIPEILNTTRNRGWGQIFMQNGDQAGIYIQDTRFVDESYFGIFTFPFIYGDPENAWTAKRSIVLEQETALQLFGDVNPVGMTLYLADTLAYTVTAVVEVPQVGTHLGFSSLIPIKTAAEDFGFSLHWAYNDNTVVYVLLAEGTDSKEVSEKIKYFMLDYIDEGVVNAASLYLQPLENVHLHSTHIGGRQLHRGDATTTRVLGIIAVLILALAVINHINLSTARSIRRSREIGIRKTVGASRNQLIGQLIGESMLLVVPAAIISAVMIVLFQPLFEGLVGRPVMIDIFDGGFFTFTLLGLVPAVGFLSGLYPALVISSLKPVSILGSASSGASSKSNLRRILIVFQFAVSVAIVTATIMIYKQVRYAMSMDPGFNREQVWVIDLPEVFMQERSYELRDRIASLGGVQSATSCSDYLVGHTDSWSMEPEGTDMDNWVTTVYSMDPDGIAVFGLKLIEGRFLSHDHPMDPFGYGDPEGSIVISEATRKDLGWDDPIGKKIVIWGRYNVTVVGVVGDIHFESARHQTEPIVYFQHTGNWNKQFIAVRLKSGMIRETIEQVEEMWRGEYPDRPMRAFFADDHVESLYQADLRFGRTMLTFSSITFFIAFLGLLGLAVHATERRKREIAIRKVLGASLASVNLLVVSEFARLIVIANLVAWPLAWWFTNRWLSSFAFKLDLDLSVFVVVGASTLAIAFGIITIQAWHTVGRNPAEVIREE